MSASESTILWLVVWWAALMVQLPLIRLLASKSTGSMSFDPNGSDLEGYGRRLTRAVANCQENIPLFVGVLLLAIVWLGDSGAYYIGKTWGRHKLAPRVSPNKTWEGSIASTAAGLLAAAVWSYWRLGEVDGWILLLAGLVSIAAQIGDLVESLLKRGAGVKDSGQILPGHGGMLDRMDALLFAAPVMWLGVELLGASRMLP